MANPTGAFGFRPIGPGGGPYNGETQRVFIPSGVATALFVGDVVKHGGSASTDGYATIGVMTAVTDIPYGVIVSFEAKASDLSLQYNPATQAGGRYARVVDVRGVDFLIKNNGVMEAADIGLNTDYAATAGSTVTGYSGFVLEAANVTTTAGDILQVQSFEDAPDNDLTLTNARVIVRFNDSDRKIGRTGR